LAKKIMIRLLKESASTSLSKRCNRPFRVVVREGYVVSSMLTSDL
jgi:hypothetical protein